MPIVIFFGGTIGIHLMTPLMLVEATNVPLRGGGVTSSGQLSWMPIMPPMAAAINAQRVME